MAEKLRSSKEKGFSIVKRLAIIIAIIIIGSIGVYFYAPRGLYINGLVPAARVDAAIIDKENGPTENLVNGKVVIFITITSGGIRDVLNPDYYPLTIRLVGPENRWSTGELPLENSGKTESNYGQTIEIDGVLDVGFVDNLYVKVSVPTTADGEVAKDTSIRVDMWPTLDATDPINGTISAASFDNECTDNFWKEKDIIDIYIAARDSLALTGFDGAYLYNPLESL